MEAFLLDFDGVVADTEPLYAVFWGNIGMKYDLDSDFPLKVKGMTMDGIFSCYFPHLPEEERAGIVRDCEEFERDMEYREVPGAIDFIHSLKTRNCKVGLVTSSPGSKMQVALKKLRLENVFDTIVTADRISQGKPDPMCYLLAAGDLGLPAARCVVFEDSFLGIEAGKRAGMKVVGLATTNPSQAIVDKVDIVIPNFLEVDKVLSCIVN